MTTHSIESLLSKCGLSEKYLDKFKVEGMTIERFEKVASLNAGSFLPVFLEKMNMTCGDYIFLMETLDSDSLKRHNSNLKLALQSTEKDIYRTPPAFDLMKKHHSGYTSSVNSVKESESPKNARLAKVQTKDQGVQASSFSEMKEAPKQKAQPVQVGVKRSHCFAFGESETKILCQNKKRAQQLLEYVKQPVSPLPKKTSPVPMKQVNDNIPSQSRPMTPTFKNMEPFADKILALFIKDDTLLK